MPVLSVAKRFSLASISSASSACTSPSRTQHIHKQQSCDSAGAGGAGAGAGFQQQRQTTVVSTPNKMAAFKKLFKNKSKQPAAANIKLDPINSTLCDEELEARKHEWQEELDEMSEFLVLKSTEEQKLEGIEQPVDTTYIEDRDGLPILKATFDIHHFTPDQVELSVDNSQLTLVAQCLEDRECAVFKKTMIRSIDLPQHVDSKLLHCQLSPDGILHVEMPFHLPPQHRPVGPSVVPIVNEQDGSRRIRLSFMIGRDFTADDIRVERNGRTLSISAQYDAEIGVYGSQVTQRQLKKELRLPEFADVDRVEHCLHDDGQLVVDIILATQRAYKCHVTTQDCSNSSPSDDMADDESLAS